MTATIPPDSRDLARRLAEAHATIQALLSGQIDAVVDSESHTPVLLAKAQGALRESEERYRRIVDTTNEGIAILDAEARFTFVNRRFTELLGYSAEEVIGKPSFPLFTEATRATMDLRVERSRRGKSDESEVALVRKDGSELWVLVKSSPIRDTDGGWTGMLGMITDRTVERANTSLEGQLRQAQKMEAVGRLAGGVAHDFNNLLSVILTYGELLREDLKPGDPMREDIEEITKAGKRAAALTRQLLMFSRQQVMETKVVDLNGVLLAMEKMLRRILGEDVELVSLTKTAVGNVLVDPSSMEQVVMNLVVNARDAMPTGGTLTIETANVVLDEQYAREHIGVKPGPHVMLAISDTGIGMDRPTQARIFEPFFTTKETGRGTGLGLSTVFGIIMQSGGSVWVQSEPGRGATFKIYLPLVDAKVDTPDATTAAATARGEETILLVEDEDQVRVAARGILTRNGYDVLEARNAGEALLLCESHPDTIHLLLSDVVMPQMSGPALAKRLSSARPGMRVLCMSGYTDDSIVRHGVLEAQIAFLQKPFTPATLTRKVRDVLDARAPT